MRCLIAMCLLIAIVSSTLAFSESTYMVGFKDEPFLAPEKIISSFDGKYTATFGTAFPDTKPIPFFLRLDDAGQFSGGRLFHFDEDVLRVTAPIATSDNGYLLVGQIGDREENSIVALKLTTNGSIQWKKKYPADGINERIEQTLELGDGFLLIGNRFNQTLRSSRLLIIKTDLQGNLIWRRAIGSIVSGFGLAVSRVQNLGAEGILASCLFGNEPSSRNDLVILKIDTTGNVVSSRTYSLPHNFSLFGGPITRTPDGGVLTAEAVTLGTKVLGILVLKVDSSGKVLSSSLLTTPNSKLQMRDGSVTSEGGLVFAGDVFRDSESHPTFGMIAKVDQSGEVQWKRLFDQRGLSFFEAVVGLPDDTIAVAGSNIFILGTFARLSSRGSDGKDCDLSHSFPINSKNVPVLSGPISLRSIQLKDSSTDVSITATSFTAEETDLCSGSNR